MNRRDASMIFGGVVFGVALMALLAWVLWPGPVEPELPLGSVSFGEGLEREVTLGEPAVVAEIDAGRRPGRTERRTFVGLSPGEASGEDAGAVAAVVVDGGGLVVPGASAREEERPKDFGDSQSGQVLLAGLFPKRGSLSGRVSFVGDIPVEQRPRRSRDCGDAAETDRLRIADGGVAGVLVYVDRDSRGVPPIGAELREKTHAMTTQGCELEPAVMGITLGQAVKFESKDVDHSIEVSGPTGTWWRYVSPRPGGGELRSVVVPNKAGRHTVHCRRHEWETAVIEVFEHPFHALTKATGGFEIEGLPHGEWTVKTSHPLLQPVSGKARVGANALSVQLSAGPGDVLVRQQTAQLR